MSPKIGIDVDDCILPLVENALLYYNNRYEDNITINQINTWDIHSLLRKLPPGINIFQELSEAGFLENTKPYIGIIEQLEKLEQLAEVYFVSASYPASVARKSQWLAEHFPFVPAERYCWITNKRLLRLDALIDDNIDNFTGFQGTKLLVAKPWSISRLAYWQMEYKERVIICKDAIEAAGKVMARIKGGAYASNQERWA